MTTREIYVVYAQIVDSNGTFNVLSGYPKSFDSKNYGNDIRKALQRAYGEFAETWGAFCKRDDRQMQSVVLCNADGSVLDSKRVGYLPFEQEPEPEPETPEEEPEGN